MRIELIRIGQFHAVDLDHLHFSHDRTELFVFFDVVKNAQNRGGLSGARHARDEHAAENKSGLDWANHLGTIAKRNQTYPPTCCRSELFTKLKMSSYSFSRHGKLVARFDGCKSCRPSSNLFFLLFARLPRFILRNWGVRFGGFVLASSGQSSLSFKTATVECQAKFCQIFKLPD